MSAFLNLSQLDPALPPASNRQILRHYLVSVGLYGVLLCGLTFNPWYRGLLQVKALGLSALSWYQYYYLLYLILAPVYFFLARPRSLWISRNLLVMSCLGRWARAAWRPPADPGAARWTWSEREKVAVIFLLIKLYYGPLMLNSVLFECNGLPLRLRALSASPTPLLTLDYLYLLLVALVFILDSALFCFGYHCEAGFLKNRLRYVETSLGGLLVCLICYPPFNMATINLFGPSNYDLRILVLGRLDHPLTWVFRGLALVFLLLLLAASFSLFTRASNLTHRGIVTWGPYRYVRHPGYVAKNLFWLMTVLPALIPNPGNAYFTWPGYLIFSAGTVCSVVAWCSIYYLRALTEEKLLGRDPEYVAYCQRVRYRFIPGLW